MKDGFYWVKTLWDMNWTVGRRTSWDLKGRKGHCWFIVESEDGFQDEDMEHIGAFIKGQPNVPSTALEEVL